MPILETILTVAGSLGGSVGAIGASTRVVHEDQRGMIMRWGKVTRHQDGTPKVILPGFRLIIPGVDQLRKVHMRTMTVNLPTQSIMLKDNTVFRVGGMIMVRVNDTPQDIYQVLFETENIRASVADLCTAALRDLISGMTYDQMTDPTALAEQAQAGVEERLAHWGLRVMSFKLTDCSPTTETARLVLISTETTFRANALVTAARVLAGSEAASRISPNLAAALIGTPVAATIGTQTTIHQHLSESEDEG